MKRILVGLLLLGGNSIFANSKYEEALKLAEVHIEKTIKNDYIVENKELYENFLKMKSVLKKSIEIEESSCEDKSTGVVAYVDKFYAPNTIYVCEEYNFLSVESIAQSLVHEIYHLGVGVDEWSATRYELIGTYLGGRTPELYGFVVSDLMEDVVEEYTVEDFILNRHEYFLLMNVRSKRRLKELSLKGNILYGKCDQAKKTLDILCLQDMGCKKDILSKNDKYKVSLNDLNKLCPLVN